MKKSFAFAWLPLLVLALGCQSTKSSNPLSPSVAGPIPGVSISPPTPVTPQSGAQVVDTNQPITLTVSNATTSGVRPLNYLFEVATDAAFNAKVFSKGGVTPGSGKTSLLLPDRLATGHAYYWRARAQDGANTGPYSNANKFDVYTPVVIQAPAPTEPIGNAVTSSLHPKFAWGNAARSGPAGAMSYTIEISATSSFATHVAVWNVDEQSGSTSLNALQDFAYSAQYYWHVRAHDTANNLGPWSATQAFRTLAAPVVLPPPGGGGGGGGAAPGTPCSGSTEYAIVQCRRNQYGSHMSASEIVAMLKGVAQDLNNHGFPYKPYGILEKPGGTSCNGYSCDIICSGQGSSQKQFDVLGDADPGTGSQTPGWSGPLSPFSARVCDPQ